MRVLAVLATTAMLLASCAGASVAPTIQSAPPGMADDYPAATTAPAPAAAVPAPPEVRLYSKLRAFVASETTNSVWVYEAAPDSPFALVTKIPVGSMPHQMAVSPDGEFVAVNNRMANTTSIIDPIALKEIARI